MSRTKITQDNSEDTQRSKGTTQSRTGPNCPSMHLCEFQCMCSCFPVWNLVKRHTVTSFLGRVRDAAHRRKDPGSCWLGKVVRCMREAQLSWQGWVMWALSWCYFCMSHWRSSTIDGSLLAASLNSSRVIWSSLSLSIFVKILSTLCCGVRPS